MYLPFLQPSYGTVIPLPVVVGLFPIDDVLPIPPAAEMFAPSAVLSGVDITGLGVVVFSCGSQMKL